MIVGLCGGGFPAVRDALQAALPDDEIIDIRVDRPAQVPSVDVLVPMVATVASDLIDKTRPRLIQQFGVGLQGVDQTAARERGIPVAYVPGAGTGNAQAVAEIAILHLLALLRRFPEAQHSVAEHVVGQPCGTTVAGKMVTVLGVGAIGTAVIARLNAFGAVPIGVGRRAYDAYPQLAGLLQPDSYFRTADLTTVLTRSQVLIVCCPLTEETRGLISAEELGAMPAGAYLINVGRGRVVDYRALLNALHTGRLAGAGIDVAWDEPIDPEDAILAENVIATPHIGGVTEESYAAMARAFSVNVERLSRGETLLHRAA